MKTAYLFTHDTLSELCDTLNGLLADNPDWVIRGIYLDQAEEGEGFFGTIDYDEEEGKPSHY